MGHQNKLWTPKIPPRRDCNPDSKNSRSGTAIPIYLFNHNLNHITYMYMYEFIAIFSYLQVDVAYCVY